MSPDDGYLATVRRASASFAESDAGLDFGLDRIREALASEHHPEEASRPILVGGTNGKGGTAAYLAGILQEHGLCVGLFTSPHLIDIRERFRIDGQPVESELYRAIDRRLAVRAEEPGSRLSELTYFEATTLEATLVFREADVDAAIYEVGLGGRLDATNAIEPELSVLTSIGLDHIEYLGSSIREITAEKCGILRSDRPAVVGYQKYTEALDEIRRRQARFLRIAGRDFGARPESGELFVDETRALPFPSQRVPAVSLSNAAAALQASKTFLGETFGLEMAVRGLRSTKWPGRMECRRVEAARFQTDRPIELVVDAAHNRDAVEALFDELVEADVRVAGVVVGGMADKELNEMFRGLSGGAPVWGATLDGARAASRAGLQSVIPADVLREVGPVESVLGDAARTVGRVDRGVLLVFGSTYLVGAVLEQLGVVPDELATYRPRS